MLGNSSSGKELSSNTLVPSKIERVGNSDDGKGGSKFGDFDLVTTVGMRINGCSVTCCMLGASPSDIIEAVEG